MSVSVIVLDGNRIVRLEAEGIAYLDEAGIEQFIDFESCYEQYAQEMWINYKTLNNANDSDKEAYLQRMWEGKGVAIRNILTPPWADGPYIEFFTEPKIRFKFETREEWFKLREHIEESGWRTGDIT